ncbi:hypothetical protein MBANPS3_000938 [Mucor bainieri]
MYKQLYGSETTESLSASQFAVVLPIFIKKEEQFIDNILRPLFIEAGWISKLDYSSKLVFFGKLEASLYTHQRLSAALSDGEFQEMIRERRYICCLIQKDLYDGSLTLTLNIIQMRFDKDFIAASKSSISSSKAQLLTPQQLMFPSKTLTIQNYISKKTLHLPRFLRSRILADSSGNVPSVHDGLYGSYLNNVHQRGGLAVRQLIERLIDPKLHNTVYDTDGYIRKDQFTAFPIWQHLNQNERNNLKAIRHRELLEFFPLIDMSKVLDEIRMYAQEHEFVLQSADDIVFIDHFFDFHTFNPGMLEMGIKYQLLNIKKSTLLSLARSEPPRRKSSSIPYLRSIPTAMDIGILFKISTMVELANKLKEPTVSHSTRKYCSLEVTDGGCKTREQEILEKLPGYSFYMEIKIKLNQQIKLYLHQVIETQHGTEKSTLPIADTAVEIGDIYNTICDVLWNASQEHSFSECASSSSVYDHYQNFKSRLLVLLEEMFDDEISAEKDIHDLQDIYTGNTDCSCCVQISHQMILDMGVKHYLKKIAGSIIACAESSAIFGKYQPKMMIITGSLLSKWAKLNNTLYRDFIWKQLEEELCLAIYQHQMKVHLIMSHADVDLFPDEQLIKWEKYQQVVGDRRILIGINAEDPCFLYEDKGDRYEMISAMEVDGNPQWRFQLIQDDMRLLSQSGFTSRYYIIPYRELTENPGDDDFRKEAKNVYFTTDCCVYFSENQLEKLLKTSTTLTANHAIIRVMLDTGPVDLGPHDLYAGTGYPVVFSFKPQNYDLKAEFTLCSHGSRLLGAHLSTGINLEKLPQ